MNVCNKFILSVVALSLSLPTFSLSHKDAQDCERVHLFTPKTFLVVHIRTLNDLAYTIY